MKDISLKELIINTVKSGDLPRYFYKYGPIDDNLFKLLENNELWFSNPCYFNDPFDNQLNINIELASLPDIIKFVDIYYPSYSERQKGILIRAIYSNPRLSEKTIKESIIKQNQSRGICCFSSINNNIPLWSYYSDSHKGVCLKFDVLADPLFFAMPFVMKYQIEYPKFNYCLNPEEMVDSLLKTKSICWQHEQEVRIFKNSKGLFKFNKTALIEVIFGCRSHPFEIAKVINQIKTFNYPSISFKKALVKEYEFGLFFHPVKE